MHKSVVQHPRNWGIELYIFLQECSRLAGVINIMGICVTVPQPKHLLVYFCSFQKIYQKTIGLSGIRTRIVKVQGEHVVHLTTTTAVQKRDLFISLLRVILVITKLGFNHLAIWQFSIVSSIHCCWSEYLHVF